MKNLIIIGARGYGREISSLAPECRGFGVSFVVKGFLDSKQDALDAFTGYLPIIASPEDYEPCADDVFLCAMGDVVWRRHYVDLMAAKGAVFISLIHNNAHLGRNVRVGDGCFIRNNVTLTADIEIGKHSAIFDYSMVGHDCVIGDFCHLSAQTFLGGGVRMGTGVTLHPGARIVPHKTIGDGATIGAGSVVIRNVKPKKTYFGVPAEPLNFI